MSTEQLEAKITELVERNRRLANQIVGYSDRVQETIRGVQADAWDAGYKEGWEIGRDLIEHTPNPYRKTRP